MSDLIKREEALMALTGMNLPTDKDKLIALFNGRIKALLAVEAQEKIGHWEKIKSGDKAFPESIVCSRCGGENSYFDFGIGTEPIGKSFVKSKYCPNCGAKMVEEIKNE